MTPNTKKLIGALVAAALAIAVFYGVIGQQQATSIQNQANQTLGTAPATQQVGPPTSQNATAPATPSAPASQNATAPATPSAPASQNATAPATPSAPASQNAPPPQH